MAALKLILFSFILFLSYSNGKEPAGRIGRDCFEILHTNLYDKKCSCSGVYTVKPLKDLPPFKVYCDMDTDGGGWTVFQRRMDGSVDFYRKWIDYKNGFGSLNGEFWLGLDKMHRLTEVRSCLRVDMEDFEYNSRYANYSTFHVGSATEYYKLKVAGYTGDAGDSLSHHNGMKFSTIDNDNDLHASNCAISHSGGWWYKYCHVSNLNGLYAYGPTTLSTKSVIWKEFKGYFYSLKFTEMKLRRC